LWRVDSSYDTFLNPFLEIPEALASKLRLRAEKHLRSFSSTGVDNTDDLNDDDDNSQDGALGGDGGDDDPVDEAGNTDWAVIVQARRSLLACV
jgi:hypothetical protein